MGCVYVVKNKINGKCYVGYTSGMLSKRKAGHILNAVKHGMRHIFYNAIRKYGVDAFVWFVVFRSSDRNLLKDEEIWQIRAHKSKIPNGYNMTDGGDGGPTMLGRKHTEESKKKMSDVLMSPEVHVKLGKGIQTEEGRKRSLTAWRGPAAQKKSALSRTGLKRSEETKRKMSEKQRGRKCAPFSIEHRANLAIASTGRKDKPETTEKRRKAALGNKSRTGMPHSKEAKEKMRSSAIAAHALRRAGTGTPYSRVPPGHAG